MNKNIAGLLPRLMSFVIFALCAVHSAAAGMIVLSGDSNIGNAIDGSSGASVNNDNASFFTNVLGTGTRVLIHRENTSFISSASAINAHYNSLSGVNSTLDSSGSAITAASLAGVDLFLSIMPSNNYTASEISALSDFLDGSGTVFFLGDADAVDFGVDDRINAALASLGSSISLDHSSIDGQFGTTTSIDSDPLTSGVSSFTYAFTNTVSGGTSLIRSRNDQGLVFIAYDAPTQVVPEPSSLALLCMGGLTLCGVRLRRRAHPNEPLRKAIC